MQKVYRQEFIVRSYEIDPQGFASIQTICNYLQECAFNHAHILGLSVQALFEKNLTWVLSRLHVKMDNYPMWGKSVFLETWPSGASGKFAIRDFLISDSHDNIIGRATTSWMLLDLESFKPISMPEFIMNINLPDRDRELDSEFPKLPEIDHADIEKTFNVRFSDLDGNRHVNNVRYIEWAAETIPIEIWREYRITELEIGFRSETNYGDRVSVRAQINDSLFIHNIRTEKSHLEVARMRSSWQRR
jgi:acyl-ACP thioesterase